MVDVRGDILWPPHYTTPAAVTANKNKKLVPLRAMKTFIRRKKGYSIKGEIRIISPHEKDSLLASQFAALTCSTTFYPSRQVLSFHV